MTCSLHNTFVRANFVTSTILKAHFQAYLILFVCILPSTRPYNVISYLSPHAVQVIYQEAGIPL